MTVRSLARPEIRALEPYSAAAQVADTIRLNANEAPWQSPVDQFRRPMNRYPEIRPSSLRSALAGRYGCQPDQLLVTRGSSEAIDLLVRVFCRAGRDAVLTTLPSFSMYGHYATIQGARTIEVRSSADRDFEIPVAELLASCDDSTRIIFIGSPNNPTGNLISRESLLEILESRNGKSVVVVDEAYIEFAQQASVVDMLGEFDNLVVLRTLSKALALAGARCGAVIASPDVIGLLDAVQAPYALATPVVETVEDALDAEEVSESEARIQEIVDERERLRNALSEFSFVRRIWPSAANFLLVQVDDPAGLVDVCQHSRILLRCYGDMLDDCVRITVGGCQDNDRLLQACIMLEDS